MNDKELMEMAAKAAGIKRDAAGYISQTGLPMNWNPLTNDGDALRLAVKLKMNIEIDGVSAVATVFGPEYVHSANIKFRDDMKPDYATRRAIVRAAAEIGKAML